MDINDSSIKIYKRLLKYVYPYRHFFLVGILSSIVYSGIDAYFTHLMKPILDQGFIDKNMTFIRVLPFLIIGVFIFRGLASFLSTYCMTRVGRDVVMTLRNQIFVQFMKMPALFYDNAASGQLLAKITYNVDKVAETATNAITTAVQAIALIIGLLVVMFVTNWKLTLIYLFAMPIIVFIVRLASHRMRRVSGAEQDSLGQLTHIAQEAIEGYREVRMFGGQYYESEKFKAANRNNRGQALKIIVTKALSSAIVQWVGSLVLALTIIIATWHATQDQMTAGGFVSLLMAMVLILKPLKDITNVNNMIQQGLAGAASVFQLLDQKAELDIGEQTLVEPQGHIECRDLSFTYPNATNYALKTINFSLEAGKTLALVGRSGSGKTTLSSLLARFYNPSSGHIFIDGMNTQEISLLSLRKNIALVSQQITLFNDTVANNVAYGDLHHASAEMIRQALVDAYAWEFVEQLPQGMDTIVGEDGVLLSGGQRQRIAIARAILKNAPILILDEATSALDTESERHIQAALKNLMVNRTTVVIAHRLSTIEHADHILVMDQGEVVERGNHGSLLAQQGYYAKLYHMQFQDDTE